MILETIANPGDIPSDPFAPAYRRLARLARVCKDWRDYFQVPRFKQLVLDESTIPEFRQAIEHTPMRLAYIENILLRIKLPEYGCDACKRAEDDSTIDQYVTFTRSLMTGRL